MVLDLNMQAGYFKDDGSHRLCSTIYHLPAWCSFADPLLSKQLLALLFLHAEARLSESVCPAIHID
jgi:hypothetical protein